MEELIAAEVATNSNTGGYNDWYLPSRDELTEMYLKVNFNQEILEIFKM